jgi:hypothetical protein
MNYITEEIMKYNFDSVIFLNISVNGGNHSFRDTRKGYLCLDIKKYFHIDFQKIPKFCKIKINNKKITENIENNEIVRISKINRFIKINKLHFHGEGLPSKLFDDWFEFIETEFYPRIITFINNKSQQIMDDLTNKYIVKQFHISLEYVE